MENWLVRFRKKGKYVAGNTLNDDGEIDNFLRMNEISRLIYQGE